MTRSTPVHRLAAALAVFAWAAIAGADQPWPSFRGPHGTGEVLGGLPPGEGPLALELRWKRELGSGYAGISVADDTLVTAFAAGERDVVAAFDPEISARRRDAVTPPGTLADGATLRRRIRCETTFSC